MPYIRHYNPSVLRICGIDIPWTTYMENNCHIEGPTGKICLKRNKLSVRKVFENQAFLALNQWIGVWRVEAPNGEFYQFLASVAAGEDTAIDRVLRRIYKEVRDCSCSQCNEDWNNLSDRERSEFMWSMDDEPPPEVPVAVLCEPQPRPPRKARHASC